MSKFAKMFRIMGVAAGIVLVGIAVGWLGSREAPSSLPPSISTEQRSTPLKFAKSRLDSLETPAPRTNQIQPTAASTNLIADWEDHLDNILRAEGKESDKAAQLLQLFPNLPENGQVEAAQHLSNLLADQDYAPLGNLLTNSALPETVLDILLADVLSRSNSVKLPLILEMARDPQHPKTAEAKDLLELFLEDNLDQDPTKWQAQMEQWLKDNPD